MNTNIGIKLCDYVGDKNIGFVNFNDGCIEIGTEQDIKEIRWSIPMNIFWVYSTIMDELHDLGIKHDGPRLIGDSGICGSIIHCRSNPMRELYWLSDAPTVNVMIILCLLGKVKDYNARNPASMRTAFSKHIKIDIFDNIIRTWYDDTLICKDIVSNDVLNNEVALKYHCDMAYYRFTGTFNRDTSCEVPDKQSSASPLEKFLNDLNNTSTKHT